MASSPPIYCPICGAVNLPDATSCVSCGHPLAPAPSQQLLAPAMLLRQRYRILEQAGTGGFSTVYRAEDTQVHNRIVAVKEISPRRQNPEDAQKTSEAFQQEAVLLAGLSHANLPRIHDYFQEGGRWYLVLDYLQGETLEERLRRSPGKRLPVPDALEVGLQLAAVLEYLHTRQPPIIFRDVKPANVMLTAPLHAYLIDFGIARLFKPGQSKDTLVIGTVGYLAPEGYGKGQTTPRSDIYSLGVTLHQMLSGADPAEKPFHFAPLQSPVPPALAALVAEMVETEESHRPATMAQVKQRLQGMLAARAANPTEVLPRGAAALLPTHTPDQSLHPYPSTALGPHLVQPPKPVKPPRPGGFSRRTVAIGLGLGALVVGAGVMGILQQGRAIPDRNPPTPTPVPSNTATIFQAGITPTATIGPITGETTITTTFHGHSQRVFAVAWSPLDGKTIASASIDGTVKVWDAMTQKLLSTYSAATYSLGWSSNGAWLASGLSQSNVAVWDAARGKVLLVYKPSQGARAALAALLGGGHAARSMVPRRRNLPFSGGGVEALAWSPQSLQVASSGDDGLIHIWDARSGKEITSFGGNTSGVFALVWSPDGKKVVSGSGSPNNNVYIWDVATGKVLATFGDHTASITALDWSPWTELIGTASMDHSVQVWNTLSYLKVTTYGGHTDGVTSLAWSPDGLRMASASLDGTVHLWDASSGNRPFIFRGHSGPVYSVSWSRDGTHLASSEENGTVLVWEAR
jgi:serine/threonine protein kinase